MQRSQTPAVKMPAKTTKDVAPEISYLLLCIFMALYALAGTSDGHWADFGLRARGAVFTKEEPEAVRWENFLAGRASYLILAAELRQAAARGASEGRFPVAFRRRGPPCRPFSRLFFGKKMGPRPPGKEAWQHR